MDEPTSQPSYWFKTKTVRSMLTGRLDLAVDTSGVESEVKYGPEWDWAILVVKAATPEALKRLRALCVELTEDEANDSGAK